MSGTGPEVVEVDGNPVEFDDGTFPGTADQKSPDPIPATAGSRFLEPSGGLDVPLGAMNAVRCSGAAL
jgi:hypothetical protein